jgi:hypothetical protein
VPYFDLSIPRADFQTGLRMYGRPIQYPAVLQGKPREVTWANNGIPLEFAF